MGGVRPLILRVVDLGLGYFLMKPEAELRKQKEQDVFCSSLLPLQVMSFCLAVLQQEYWWLTLSSCCISLQLSGEEVSGRASGERPICTLMNGTALLHYVKAAWASMGLHSLAKGETQSLRTLKRSIWL